MDDRFGSLRMMWNLGFRYNNLPWLGWAGKLHLPTVVLTPGIIGHFEDSMFQIWIFGYLDIID